MGHSPSESGTQLSSVKLGRVFHASVHTYVISTLWTVQWIPSTGTVAAYTVINASIYRSELASRSRCRRSRSKNRSLVITSTSVMKLVSTSDWILYASLESDIARETEWNASGEMRESILRTAVHASCKADCDTGAKDK
jgi:hypothetical protein